MYLKISAANSKRTHFIGLSTDTNGYTNFSMTGEKKGFLKYAKQSHFFYAFHKKIRKSETKPFSPGRGALAAQEDSGLDILV